MKYRLINAKDYFDDNNEGLIYGIESCEDLPEYTEWFKSEIERENYLINNKIEVE